MAVYTVGHNTCSPMRGFFLRTAQGMLEGRASGQPRAAAPTCSCQSRKSRQLPLRITCQLRLSCCQDDFGMK